MNAILLDHQTPTWQMLYNPALSVEWLESFLSGQYQMLDYADYRLYDQPGELFLATERGEAVLHQQQKTLWPWQSAESVFATYLQGLSELQQGQFKYAVPLLIASRNEQSNIKHTVQFLRQFVAGIPLLDYYHQHATQTPELISLAADVCLLLNRLAKRGFQLRYLKASDIIYHEKQLILVNWWRLLPLKAKPARAALPLSVFMSAWNKRVDYHSLFLESFRRIDVDIKFEDN